MTVKAGAKIGDKEIIMVSKGKKPENNPPVAIETGRGQADMLGNDKLQSSQKLRQQAEEIFRLKAAKRSQAFVHMTPEEIQTVLHELQVHQLELEMQNEELLRTQIELDVSRERYFDLYDMAPIGYCTVSTEGLILEANLAAANLFGMARNALVRQPLSRFFLPEDQAIYYRHLNIFLETAKPQTFELRMLHQGNLPQWVEVKAISARDDDGVPAFRIVISDVSDRKRAEELRRANEAATATSAAKTRFLSMVAHEFRTPLSLLSSSLDILEHYQAHLNRKQRLEQEQLIRDASQQLKMLVDTVLSYNRMVPEEQPGTQRYHMADLSSLVTAIVEEMEKIRPSSHDFRLTISPDCADIPMDEILIRRILENLLANAFQYTPAGCRVSLDISKDAGCLQIKITDQGIGISEEDQRHVFSSFYRGRNVGSVRGMGLGLNIAEDAVLQLGGTLELASSIGQGTSLTVKIPLEG